MCTFSIEICKLPRMILAYFCTNPPSLSLCSPSPNSLAPSSFWSVGSNKRFTSHNLSALSNLSTFSSFRFLLSSSSSSFAFSTAALSSFLSSSFFFFARFATSSGLNRLAEANTSDIVTTTGSFPNFAHGILSLKLPTTPRVSSTGKFSFSKASGFNCNRRKITSPESTDIFNAVLSIP